MDRGEPQGNGKWSGILGLLRDDQCDFVVGGFFPDYDVHDDFGVTAAYFQVLTLGKKRILTLFFLISAIIRLYFHYFK